MAVRVVAAPWVLPGPDAAPLTDGAVVLDDDRVVEIGPRAAIEARPFVTSPTAATPAWRNAVAPLAIPSSTAPSTAPPRAR